MAAYGVKYELQFADNRGHKRTLQILKKDYADEIFSLVASGSPAIIRYENNDDFYNPIIGSSCTINLKVTDTISYDEFQSFDEREYKIKLLAGQEDDTVTLDSPLWEVANTNWEDTETLWAQGTIFETSWEGFLVSDNYTEHLISTPYDLQLKAIDNLGTLDSYNVPFGNIETEANGDIKVSTGSQNNYDSAFYYLRKILELTGLEFNIYIQNNIKRKIGEVVINSQTSLFHDIYINEFALTDDFVRKNAKDVLKEILRLTNSRIFQSNASWYVISNHNYYERSILSGGSGGEGETQNQEDNSVTKPVVVTNDTTNITTTSATLNGTISDDRGLEIFSRGFYFGQSSTYANNTLYLSSDTTSSFTFSATGLTSGAQYYVTAFAQNTSFEYSVGNTLNFVADTTTSTTTVAKLSPTVDTLQPLATQVFDTKMTLRGRVGDIGTSNVTEYGFYFGTDPNNFSNNTKYAVATGASESAPFTFTLDTSSIPLTLTAGTAYYCFAYAINSTGQTVATKITQQTYNVWNLYNVSTNATKLAIYDSTRANGDSVTLSDSGSTCFTVLTGTTILSTSGLPTINGDCSTVTSEITTEEIKTCKAITLFRASTAKILCCEDVTSKVHYINGETFLDNTGTTKVYIDNTCDTLLATAQYLSQDLNQYRYWNGTTLQNKITCQSSSVDKCAEDVVTPDAFLVQNEVTGTQQLVQYDGAYVPGDRVVISSDSEYCYDIIEEYQASASPTATITASCTTATPTPTETCPTMTFFNQYQGCGDDNVVIVGNSANVFPNIIKQLSTGDCYFNVGSTSLTTSDNEFNLGCYPTNKFETKNGEVYSYPSCDECEGITTTAAPSTTTTTTAAPSIYYRVYQGLQSNCSADDFIIEVYNQTNSFPSVISDGVICYSSLSDGGNGSAGDVDSFLDFSDCTTCQTYLGTTTTQAPTTTQPPCISVTANVTTVALNACCGDKAKTIYINANTLAAATIVYTDANCTTILSPGNYIVKGGDKYFWNGNSLVEFTCPGCP